MPALPNPKHEIFCKAIVAGENQTSAYEHAGFQRRRSSASALRKKKYIAERVDELVREREAAIERRIERATTNAKRHEEITRISVIEELAKIGFANMKDYMGIDESGQPFVNWKTLTRDQAAAIVSVTVDEFVVGRGEAAREVRKVTFKLADKKGALVDIGKELGMFIERKEAGKPGDFASMAVEELDRRLLSLLVARGMPEAEAKRFIGSRRPSPAAEKAN